MRANELINQLDVCKKYATTAQPVLDKMIEAFEAAAREIGAKPFSVYNADCDAEEPFVKFDLNSELSSRYSIAITPEIRDHKLIMTIDTNRMRDNAGIGSRTWDTINQDVLEYGLTDISVASALESALSLAQDQHMTLLNEVGIQGEIAREAVSRTWMKPLAQAVANKP